MRAFLLSCVRGSCADGFAEYEDDLRDMATKGTMRSVRILIHTPKMSR